MFSSENQNALQEHLQKNYTTIALIIQVQNSDFMPNCREIWDQGGIVPLDGGVSETSY